MSRQEIKIFKDDDEIWDICFNETGDFVNEDSYDTDIEMSLFTYARADASQVPEPQNRRGWFGDQFSTLVDFRLGSLLWLLEQARNTIVTASNGVTYVQEALSWMARKGYVDLIEVTSSRNLKEGILTLTTTVRIDNDEVKTFTFDLFKLSKFAGNTNVKTCFVEEVVLLFMETEGGDEMLTESGDLMLIE